MTIEELNLEPTAATAAAALLAAHPGVVFTSGRRGVAEQASAMASNIVRNRQWIAETYVSTAQSIALQRWVDAHPNSTGQSLIDDLARLMTPWTDAQKAALSKHFSGQAFDVQPGSCPEEAIRALPGLTKFLTVEGGLVRWHAQF